MNTPTQAQLAQLNAALLNNPMTFGRPSLPMCASEVRPYALGSRLPDWAVSEVTGAVKNAVAHAIRYALGIYNSEDQGAFALAYAGGLPDMASLILDVPLAAEDELAEWNVRPSDKLCAELIAVGLAEFLYPTESQGIQYLSTSLDHFAAILGFSVREVIDMRWREVLERDLPALTAREGTAV